MEISNSKFNEEVQTIVSNLRRSKAYVNSFGKNKRICFSIPSKTVLPKKVFSDLAVFSPLKELQEVHNMMHEQFCMEGMQAICRHLKNRGNIEPQYTTINNIKAGQFDGNGNTLMVSAELACYIYEALGFIYADPTNIGYTLFQIIGSLNGRQVMVNPFMEYDNFFVFDFGTMDFEAIVAEPQNEDEFCSDEVRFNLNCSYEDTITYGKASDLQKNSLNDSIINTDNPLKALITIDLNKYSKSEMEIMISTTNKVLDAVAKYLIEGNDKIKINLG